MEKVHTVPIEMRYALSINQAADYFGIGQKKLRQIVTEHTDSNFVLHNGSKVQIKRKLFEQFLDKTNRI